MKFASIQKAALLALAALFAASAAEAQQAAPPGLIVHTLETGKVYWVEGGGGNSGVIIGDKGVVVIDAKTTIEGAQALLAEVAKLTPKPITHLIETHSDGDHVNGVAAFPPGIKIIAHVNNRNDQIVVPIQATTEIGGGRCIPPQDRLPNILIYGNKVATTLNGVRMVIYHFGPAHTTGDLTVYLPDEKIAFTGDILTFNVMIHPEKNGSLDGWFKTTKALLALEATTYVPGHASAVDTKEMLRKRIAGIQASRDKVNAMVDQGKSLAEIKTMMRDPPKDSIGCRGIPYPSLSWVEYQDRIARNAELK